MKILLFEFYTQPNADYPKIAEAFRHFGHTALVGALNDQGDLEWREGDELVAKQGLGTVPARKGGRKSLLGSLKMRYYRLRQLSKIRSFIRDARPDIVQINASGLYRLLPIGMPDSISFILDVRQINELYGTSFFGRIRSRILNDSRVVFSRYLYDRSTFLHEAGAEKVLGEDWAKWASIVPFAVDPEFTTVTATNGHRGRNGETPGNKPVDFIYIGRLTRRRLLERLIDASSIVREHTRDFRFIFMGIDESKGYYQEMIEEKNLGDVVEVKAPIPYEDVPHEVLRHDVAVAYVPELPVDWKYHPPIKILEYRALGMPILATDFKPNYSFVEPGVNGLLVDNDPNLIAQAMLRFIDDRAFLSSCHSNAAAMRRVQTWDEVARMYIDNVYSPLVEAKAARRR